MGSKRPVTIPLNKIIDFESFSDGIKISKDRGRDQVFMHQSDAEIVAGTLAGVLRAP